MPPIGNIEDYGYRDDQIELIANNGNGISIEQRIIDNRQNAEISGVINVNNTQEKEISGNTTSINNIITVLEEGGWSVSGGTGLDAGTWD